MKDAAGIYQGENGRAYLALYNFNSDVFRMLSPEFPAERVAHFSYEFGRRVGGVDVFMLSPESRPEEIAKIVTGVRPFRKGYEIIKNTERKKRRLYVSEEDLEGVREKHNIHVQILNTLPQEIRDGIIYSTNTDILEFCEGKEAREKETPRTDLVDRIISKTEIKYIEPQRVLTPGKQEFVPDCILEANIDFGQGCISNWIPGENASFDGQFFTDYYMFKSGGCSYCYAERSHRTYPKTIYQFDKDRLLEELGGGFITQLAGEIETEDGETMFLEEKKLGRPVEVLRFGKRTESYTPFTDSQFMQTLEACVETGTRGVIPTKFLPYTKEKSKLIKKTNSVPLFSLGDDRYERGAVAYGFSNEVRMENAIKYREDKTNSLIYLNVPNPLKLSEKEWKIIEKAKKHNLKVQVLPLRFKKSSVMNTITGMHRKIAIGPPDLFASEAGAYYWEGTQAIPIINSMDAQLI